MKKYPNDHALNSDNVYGTRPEPTFGGVTSFMRRRYTKDLSGVDVAVMGIPFDTATTNRSGTRMGPRAIRNASTTMAWERPYGMDFDPFDKLAVVDIGDCYFEHSQPQGVPQQIEEYASGVLDDGAALLSLGGDHFVTYPVLKAHAKKFGAPLSLLHFDAHTDTWADKDGGIDHGTMFWHATNEGLIDPATSMQVGIRTSNPDTMGFGILDAPDVHRLGIDGVVSAIRERIGNKPVYLTFDIDCIDPAFAPGTGTPVCGGLNTHQALSILRGLQGINLIGMDLVEVAPQYDVGEITALAATALAMEMLYLYANRPT